MGEVDNTWVCGSLHGYINIYPVKLVRTGCILLLTHLTFCVFANNWTSSIFPFFLFVFIFCFCCFWGEEGRPDGDGVCVEGGGGGYWHFLHDWCVSLDLRATSIILHNVFTKVGMYTINFTVMATSVTCTGQTENCLKDGRNAGLNVHRLTPQHRFISDEGEGGEGSGT